jgi:PEP-CTERM motif
MKNVFRVCFLLAAAAVFGFAPSAKADGMTLTGTGPNGAAFGVYVGPYTATINGTPTPVICDDFADESFLNESWNASVLSLADVTASSSVKWASQASSYDNAAWLTLQLIGAPNKSQADAIQFAIWDLFDPSGVSSYLAGFSGGTSFLSDATDPNGVKYWLNEAAGSNLDPSELASFLIYTPTSCISNCKGSLPQEFIVKTPEPGGFLMLGAGLAALLWFKRRELGATAA